MLKKLSLLLVTVLAATSVHAKSDYDVSLKYGLTSLDNKDGLELKNHTLSADMSFDVGYALKPRVDLTYVNIEDDVKWGGVSSLMQIALNAQYGKTFDMVSFPHELYLFGGLGYEYVVDGTDYFDSLPFFQGGLGAKYGISKNLNLVAEFKALQVFDSNNASDDEDNEFTFLLGLNFPFGSEEKKPVREVKVLDGDYDGVADNIDLCPKTIRGTKVDLSGCAVKKALEVPVVKAAAPIILLDSDNDTITDDIDQCPDTPLGAKVDASGCQEKRNLKINFESNSAEIKKESLANVKEFADFMKNMPEGTVAIIEGYTDSSGNAEKNRALSSKRAFAVRKALIKEGVKKGAVRAYGRGSKSPIADNATVEGRAQNRRIEVTIKHKGEI